MVALTAITTNNALLASSTPTIAVFVGGTSGIGKLTLTEMSNLGMPIKAYIIGRKSSYAAFKAHSDALCEAHPATKIVWIEAEVSLLAEVKRVCGLIKSREGRLDLLFMTTGYAPFGGRDNTPEGLDVTHALEFYTRMCFVENLLPLLRASGRARVISVLAAGMEYARFLDVDDLNLDRKGGWGVLIGTQMHMAIMNTLTLERLAEQLENQSVTFIHSHPGMVRTGNLYRGSADQSWGPWIRAIVMDPWLRLVAISHEESARRYVYQATSGAFGGHGPNVEGIVGRTTRGETKGGLFLVSRTCDTVLNERELAKLRVEAAGKVEVKVREILGPYVE